MYAFQRVSSLDLFSQIYNHDTCDSSVHGYGKGMPPEAAQFYCANILLALAHMHARKVCFRNLKPENCLIDAEGYIKIVGFGFAKTIPYTFLESMQHKTYTLCGTPGMLCNVLDNIYVTSCYVML